MVVTSYQINQLCSFGDDTTYNSGFSHGITPLLQNFQASMFVSISNPLLCYQRCLIMKAGLGLPDTDSWNIIETIAEKNNIGYTQLVCQSSQFYK